VFDAPEPFLLCSRNDLAIAKQASRGIAVVSIYADDDGNPALASVFLQL
jgi:hypothetical protein